MQVEQSKTKLNHLFYFLYLAQRCNHCSNQNEDENTLEPCSNCDGYTHNQCIDKCPVLVLKMEGRLACFSDKLTSKYLTSVSNVFRSLRKT